VRARCLLMPRPLGLLTDSTHFAADGSPPPPLTHWELIAIEWTYSGYLLPNHAHAASRWLRILTVVRPIVDRWSMCLLQL